VLKIPVFPFIVLKLPANIAITNIIKTYYVYVNIVTDSADIVTTDYNDSAIVVSADSFTTDLSDNEQRKQITTIATTITTTTTAIIFPRTNRTSLLLYMFLTRISSQQFLGILWTGLSAC
jgi:hypothetical protein